MLNKKVNAIALILIIVLVVLLPVDALPSVSIQFPQDNSTVRSKTVTINGTSTGTTNEWMQKSYSDFKSGTIDNITINPSNLTLGVPIEIMYDNFNTGFDISKWTKVEQNGMSAFPANGLMVFSGTSTSYSGAWNSYAYLQSTSILYNVSADIELVGGITYWKTSLKLYQDDQNWVDISVVGDPNTLPVFDIITGMMKSGTESSINHGDGGDGLHTFKIAYANGEANIYVDGVFVQTYYLSLVNPKVMIGGWLYRYGYSMNACWDNVRGTPTMNYCNQGIFISVAHDTGTVKPILKNITWSANIPKGSNLAINVRSSDYYNMSSPSGWTAVAQGQTTGLPDIKRYLQYMVSMTGDGGFTSPSLDFIWFEHMIPIKLVEVSIDEKATWRTTYGTEKWWITLTVPEERITIWVRATDTADSRTLASITVNIDVTRPTGTFLINSGDSYTETPEVTLMFDAIDNYAVQSVIFSENPDLSDANWLDYSSNVPFILTPDEGGKTVYVKFRDVNGLESDVVSNNIILDSSIPTGFVLINGGAEYTNDIDVKLIMNATDGVGITGFMASNNPNFLNCNWMNYVSMCCWTLAGNDGEKTVYIKFRDGFDHESKACSDSIILDTIPPNILTTLNAGALYTNRTNITLIFTIIDDNKVNFIEISQNSSFSNSTMIPALESIEYTLFTSDGEKMIYTRAIDAANNIGPVNISSIIEDLTPPISEMDRIPQETDNCSINLSWNGTDKTSGIKAFDVQVKGESGLWTDWLHQTSLTKAIFVGQPNHTYYFRVRAIDNGGNVQNYPDKPEASVKIYPAILPIVSIVSPKEKARISGIVIIHGTAYHPDSRKIIEKVQIRVDDQDWSSASGTLDWKYRLDTAKLPDSDHKLQVRAFDGERYSSMAEINFTVTTNQPTPNPQIQLILLTGVLIIVIITIGVFFFIKKNRSNFRYK